jgi:hypothetical protein
MPPPAKRENILVNLIFNIVVPSLILAKASTPDRLGPVWGLIIALLFPISYGMWDFVQRKQANFISILGFTNVLLTGTLGLMKADLKWFAIQEAATPTLIGLALWGSMYTSRPLIRQFLFNDQVMDVDKIYEALEERQKRPVFEKLLKSSTYLMIFSFALSAVLNFALAKWLLQSPPGSPELNAELGKMKALSWPVIALPSGAVGVWALWRLISGITKLTGLKFEEMLHAEHVKKS